MKWLALALPSFLVVTLVHAASFDCAKARANTEQMICGDAELSRLDDELAKAYKKALARADAKDAARKSQRLWLKNAVEPCLDA